MSARPSTSTCCILLKPSNQIFWILSEADLISTFVSKMNAARAMDNVVAKVNTSPNTYYESMSKLTWAFAKMPSWNSFQWSKECSKNECSNTFKWHSNINLVFLNHLPLCQLEKYRQISCNHGFLAPFFQKMDFRHIFFLNCKP